MHFNFYINDRFFSLILDVHDCVAKCKRNGDRQQVCGRDRKPYFNLCHARCFNTTMQCRRRCPCVGGIGGIGGGGGKGGGGEGEQGGEEEEGGEAPHGIVILTLNTITQFVLLFFINPNRPNQVSVAACAVASASPTAPSAGGTTAPTRTAAPPGALGCRWPATAGAPAGTGPRSGRRRVKLLRRGSIQWKTKD